MNRTYEIIDKIIEIEIYLYIIFIFLTKGEGIRNILLFSGFFLWLATLRRRGNKHILAEPVSMVFWGFIITILISVIFSLDTLYSFKSLRGYPLKSVMIFCLVSTVLSDEKRLKRFICLSHIILIFIIAVSYYSYFAHGLPLMYPDTPLMHANPNRLAVSMNILIAFSIVLFLAVKSLRLKAAIVFIILLGISALIFSGSRGGNMAFLSLVCVWSVYFLKKKEVSNRIFLSGLLATFILFGVVLYNFFPGVKAKFLHAGVALESFSGRLEEIWIPLISAARERPVFGWGYGSNIFKEDLPFENTPYKRAPVTVHPIHRNPHNAFLRVLFHQGVAGLIFYVLLLIFAVRSFGKGAFGLRGFKGHILAACLSILISTYLIHALVENSKLTNLSLILAIGLAGKNMKRKQSFEEFF